ncbi:MAG: FimV/HubP family polar landmark protein, partial [Thiotrichaceae bacterium]|nr:FimV/HubP family polar landmark protein [Thiotrichaceae bacterium]
YDLASSAEIIYNSVSCLNFDKSKATTLSVFLGSNNHTYKVKAGDTLSEIAQRTKLNNISLKEQMELIFRQNSHAFISNNRNKIKEGVFLRLPLQLAENYILFKMILNNEESKKTAETINIKILPNDATLIVYLKQPYKINIKNFNNYYKISIVYNTPNRIWQYALKSELYINPNKCKTATIKFNDLYDKEITYHGIYVFSKRTAYIFLMFIIGIGFIVGVVKAIQNYIIALKKNIINNINHY